MSAEPIGTWPGGRVRFTEAEFDDLPGHDRYRYEIIDGELHAMAPAGDEHQSIGAALYVLLRQAAPDGWKRARIDTWSRLPTGDLWAPDVFVPRPGTLPVDDKWNVVDLALTVEIVSSSTVENDLVRKPAAYARCGVDAYWRIDRDERGWPVFHVHTLPDSKHGSYHEVRTVTADERYQVDVPFPFTIDAAAIMAIADEG
jgi:Uma2 family endonuclease